MRFASFHLSYFLFSELRIVRSDWGGNIEKNAKGPEFSIYQCWKWNPLFECIFFSEVFMVRDVVVSINRCEYCNSVAPALHAKCKSLWFQMCFLCKYIFRIKQCWSKTKYHCIESAVSIISFGLSGSDDFSQTFGQTGDFFNDFNIASIV